MTRHLWNHVAHVPSYKIIFWLVFNFAPTMLLTSYNHRANSSSHPRGNKVDGLPRALHTEPLGS